MRPVVLGLVPLLVVLSAPEGFPQGSGGLGATRVDLARLEALTVGRSGRRPRFDLEGPHLVDRSGGRDRRIPLDRARAQVQPRDRILALVCAEGARCAREGRRAVTRLAYRVRGGRAALGEALDLVLGIQDRIDPSHAPGRSRLGLPPGRVAWPERYDDPWARGRGHRTDERDRIVGALNRIFARARGPSLALRVDEPHLLVRRGRSRYQMPLDLVVGGIDRTRELLCIRCRAGARCIEEAGRRQGRAWGQEVCARVDLGPRGLDRARDDIDRIAAPGRRGSDHVPRRR